MVKKIIIFLFILPIFLLGISTTIFVYSEETQSFIIQSFNLKSIFDKKIKKIISRKINDENITIKISSIKLLKPNWPNVVKIEISDVEIHTISQKEKSKIELVELGFSFENLLQNILYKKENLAFSYLNFKDLALNVKLEENKFIPGPLIKIFSLLNQKDFIKQQSLKKIFKNKITIGNVRFLLLDKRNPFKESSFNILCNNVFVSKYLNKTRSLNMNCNQNKILQFSVKADLFENFNNFSGNILNIDPKTVFSTWFQENIKLYPENVSGLLNGKYKISTNKNFEIETFSFLIKKSRLIIKNRNNIIAEPELSGEILWDREHDLININNFSIGDIKIQNTEINRNSKTGFSTFNIKKSSISAIKKHLVAFERYYNSSTNLNFIKNYNDIFKGGSLNNINIDLKFSFSKKIKINDITGEYNFTNVRVDYDNKIFKKILCDISGKVKFEVKTNDNKIINNKSWIEVDIESSNLLTQLKKNNLEYDFDFAKIIVKINKNNFIISRAEFFKNDLKYLFADVEINEDNYKISNAMLFKNNKLQYILKDTEINNQTITNSLVKVKNNHEFSNYLKKNLNIEIIGDVEFNFILSGNIKNLDLNLKLSSDLTNSTFNINYLNLTKKKNIISSIKTEIIYKKGKLALIKNIMLKIESKHYKINLVKVNDKSFKKVLLKNIKTPKLNLEQLSISKKDRKIDIFIIGKNIDISYLRNNLQNQSNNNININFDITADEIILDPKISLAGSLKGIINKSIFEATAFGRMWLNKSSLLDSGKFQIYVDDKISELKGFGLVGGAETKIIMKKNKNKLPQIFFDTLDGGKLLKALGFTKNIRSGKMKMNINFLNNEYSHYEGVIKSQKFSLINTPGIINSLSILSFSGIQSVISGEGVYFDKGQANINFKNNNFMFDKVYLSSQSLGIAAKGKINLKNKVIDIRGSVAPIKLISQILSVVPAVGELITGLKKEGLFAGQFKMIGSIENPKVKLNTLSFAPGILRDLFAEDWLNNDNFFINDN